ncbi:hypothetical protein ACROYT_G008892 [Oculina patagonica]
MMDATMKSTRRILEFHSSPCQMSVVNRPFVFHVESIDPGTIREFVNDLQDLYLRAKHALDSPDVSAERLTSIWRNLDAAVLSSKRIQWHLVTTKPCSEDILAAILNNFSTLERLIGALIDRYSCLVPFLVDELRYRAPLTATGAVGRPSYIINREQLEIMRRYGISWTDIAKSLGVSLSTIWRRRVHFNMERRRHAGRRTVGMQELLEIIAEIKERAAGAGIIMIEGELAAQSLRASRTDIAEALIVLDPIGARLRWRNITPRVTYNVPGPNSLWHIDGNHKMIRWRLVVHGGIDGYSRLVVFLNCSDNNRSATVANLFMSATDEYCWPSRVRTDKGGENVEVARLMIQRRGEGRGSILQGSSVHNQRIERLWRDMRKMVTEYFRRLFYFLETQNLLDPNSDLDLFALHFVFMPRINRNLTKFKAAWNNHKLSTEHQKTPNQLYILGMLKLFGSSYCSVTDFFENNTVNEEEYGVSEPEIADAVDVDDITEVVVPENRLRLSDDCLRELCATVDPLTMDGNHGISLYLETKRIINSSTID